MIKQHCIGSGRDCDRSTIYFFMWLIQILDGGWNEGFKGSLGFYLLHSVCVTLLTVHVRNVDVV